MTTTQQVANDGRTRGFGRPSLPGIHQLCSRPRICDSLVLQNSDLNSPIFRAPGCSLVIGDGLGLTISKGLNQPPQIQTMHANQVLNYGLGASFAQGAISRRIAGGIRKSHYFNQPTVRVPLGLLSFGPGCRFIDGLSWRLRQ